MSIDVDPVWFILDLHMKYTVELVLLHMYIVWFVIQDNHVLEVWWLCPVIG